MQSHGQGNTYNADNKTRAAVLSKVFTIMNALLKQNLETRKRSLGIRTYKVLPLAPRCGIVEWVQNTAPIGEYLVRAHTRYGFAKILNRSLHTFITNVFEPTKATILGIGDIMNAAIA